MSTQLDEDRVVNPGQEYYSAEFNRITSTPDMQALADQGNAIARDDLLAKEGGATADTDTANRAEADKLPYTPPASASSDQENQKGGRFRSAVRGKKALAAAGIGGSLGAILLMFSALLPLKFEALIGNALKAAETIPAYAIQERSEYLVTRVLATRMLQISYGLDDSDIEPVFCKTRGAIGCSLLATYTSKYISESMGLDMIKVGDNKVKVSINAKGRQYLGGYAKSWEIELTRDWGDSGVLKTVKTIESRKEMRAYLKTRVNKQYKNTLTRYVARRILMMKYGVKSWRAFEKTQEKIDNKVADVKTQFKVGIYKNTIGKISPRFAAYIACLQGGTMSCEETLKTLSDGLNPPGDEPTQNSDETDTEFKKKHDAWDKNKKQYDALAKIGANIRGEIPETPAGNALTSSLKKVFSTKMLATASGVLSAVMITDLVLTAANSVDKGALDQVGFDMASQAYTGFAFGDDTGIVTNWEKTKVGDAEGDVGAEVMNELSTLVDCDGSTLCAYENGYAGTVATASLTTTAGATAVSYSRECETSEGTKTVTLAPGELVCPERKLYRNYAGLFVDNPAFQSLVPIAEAWTASGHKIIEWVGDTVSAATSWITEPLMEHIFKPLGDVIMKQAEPLIAWFMDSVFNPPSVGYDTTPANNYDAMSGALHIEQWELMKNGVEDGQVLGGGGQYLSEKEAQEVLAYQKQEEQEEFNNQSLFARLFDTSLKGSLAQQLVLQMPDSSTELALLPSKALASLTNLSTATAASNATTNASPFGLPLYGYKISNSVIRADPDLYTDEYCSASAEARENTKAKKGTSTVEVYTQTDPCALEKLVVGSLITAANPTDKYAFQSISGTGTTTSTTTGGCAQNTTSLGVYDQAHDNGKQISIELCELSSINLQSGFYTEQDPEIFRSGSGGIVVGASVSDGFQKLGEAALAEKPSRQLVGKGIRSYEKQQYFYDCYISKKCNNGNLAAEPGTSNHENGTAIDFVLSSGDLTWLRANGSTFGFKELTEGSQPEQWHWSPVEN